MAAYPVRSRTLPQTDAEQLWLALDLTTDAPDAWAGVGLSVQGGMKVCQRWAM
jgi:hypothetical protein